MYTTFIYQLHHISQKISVGGQVLDLWKKQIDRISIVFGRTMGRIYEYDGMKIVKLYFNVCSNKLL